MTEQEIIEGNILIADFMGEKYTISEWDKSRHSIMRLVREDAAPDCLEYCCGYDESWDWLMPVVEKIEAMTDYSKVLEGDGKSGVKLGFNRARISKRDCVITISDGLFDTSDFYGEGGTKIEAVYQAVIQFIKHHNSLTSK